MSLSRDERLEHAARWLVQAQDKAFTPEDRKMLEMEKDTNGTITLSGEPVVKSES